MTEKSFNVVPHTSTNVTVDGQWVASFQNEADARAFVSGESKNAELIAELQAVIDTLKTQLGAL